jgi:hypothetical protein
MVKLVPLVEFKVYFSDSKFWMVNQRVMKAAEDCNKLNYLQDGSNFKYLFCFLKPTFPV